MGQNLIEELLAAIKANTAGGGGGGAVTEANGANVTLGAIADAIVAAGAAGTVSAKLRRVTQGLEDLKSLQVLAAGANLIGKVGFDQTTDGTTNRVVPPNSRWLDIPASVAAGGPFTPKTAYSAVNNAFGTPWKFSFGASSASQPIVFGGITVSYPYAAISGNGNNMTGVLFNAAPDTAFADDTAVDWYTSPDTAKIRGFIAFSAGSITNQATNGMYSSTGPANARPVAVTADSNGDVYLQLLLNAFTATLTTPGPVSVVATVQK